jgi:hypothetical protein
MCRRGGASVNECFPQHAATVFDLPPWFVPSEETSEGHRTNVRCLSTFESIGGLGPFNIRESRTHAVFFLQHVPFRSGPAIHSDETIGRLAVRHALAEELADCAALGRIDVSAKPLPSLLVKNSHIRILSR